MYGATTRDGACERKNIYSRYRYHMDVLATMGNGLSVSRIYEAEHLLVLRNSWI